MTFKEAVEAYAEKWEGYPAFLMMGMNEEEAVKMLMEALKKGEEITAIEGNVY